MKRLVALAAAVALLVPLLAGCGSSGRDDGKLEVLAAIYPLQYLTQRLVGPDVSVDTLTTPGVEPHDLELSPRQVAGVSEADLVVYEAGLQPAVDKAVRANAKGHGLDIAPAADLADGNPHFWLDPVRMESVARVVAARLAKVDPDHGDAYQQRLDRLEHDLATLDHDYRTGLQHCARTIVVTSHDAFGYLARYGLELHSIAGLSPDAAPSPAHLAELRDLIRSDGITTVFSEPSTGSRMAEVLSDDLGLVSTVLDPIETVDPERGKDYLDLMRDNLAALRTANDCRGTDR